MRFAILVFAVSSAFAAEKLTQEEAMQVREPQDLATPDGKTLALLSDREDSEQIYLMSSAGGEALKLTSGNEIAFRALEPRTDEEDRKQRGGGDQRVMDSIRLARVWTVEQITRGNWAIRDFDWMPDSKRLVACRPRG